MRARYHDTRSRRLLTAVGEVKIRGCWYVCWHCGRGHSPRDRELGIEGTDVSPVVRRMMAVVGSETSFEHGRDQLELLAGLEVTAKAVERQAEAIGTDIEAREQNEIRRAKQRMGYRIHEVPAGYNARGVDEGKKIRARDGFEALRTLIRCRFTPLMYQTAADPD